MRLILTVKVLRLLHEKLRALLPLALQQLLQTLRNGHVAVHAATAEHRLQRILSWRGVARNGSGVTLEEEKTLYLKFVPSNNIICILFIWYIFKDPYLLAGERNSGVLRVH